jgi:hypothetical protein
MNKQLIVTICIGFLGLSLLAELPTRTQEISLQPGWNAVWLEVQPAESTPAAVFANAPVDIVACFFPPRSTVQFVSNPSQELWGQPGWGVWYAASRPDAFLTTLKNLQAHKPYLVHAARAHTLSVTGAVTYQRLKWSPNAFNLLGFSVDPENPPTFANYFAGSSSHSQCYELRNGSWALIDKPESTLVESGRAYWVFSKGGSDYQGPLDLALPNLDRLAYEPNTSSHTLKVRAAGVDPSSVYLTPDGDAFRIRLREKVPQTLRYTARDLEGATHATDLEAGDDTTLTVQIDARGTGGSMLLRLSDNSGCLYHIPVEYLEGE